MQIRSNLFATIVKLNFWQLLTFFGSNEGKGWYRWAQRNKVISQKNSHPLRRSCKRQTDLQLFSIQHLPSQYSPGTVSSSKRARESCPGDGANHTAQAHSPQGLQMTFYRGTEELQFFSLNTGWWHLWACGHVMWALCSSPLPTHIIILLRGVESCREGVIIICIVSLWPEAWFW